MFPSGQVTTSKRVTGTITNVSGTYPTVTVTVKLNDATQLLTVGDYPAGTGLIIYSNTHSEGSDQPAGQVNKPLQDSHYLKICKGSFDNTGTQMIMETWFDVMTDGKGNYYYVLQGQEDAEYLLQADVDGAMLFDRLLTNSDIDPVTLKGI
jgi:hypothetical protein